MSDPVQHTDPEAYSLEDDGSIPNNPDLPFLVYKCESADEGADLAAFFEERFESNDWSGCWRNGIFPYHHYHSVTHEALAVYSGQATVALGGENGERITIKRGDVLVLPAGVGHKRLEASADFGVVGAYPEGRDHDLLRGDASDRPHALENIRQVPLPRADPLHGPAGPITRLWQR